MYHKTTCLSFLFELSFIVICPYVNTHIIFSPFCLHVYFYVMTHYDIVSPYFRGTNKVVAFSILFRSFFLFIFRQNKNDMRASCFQNFIFENYPLAHLVLKNVKRWFPNSLLLFFNFLGSYFFKS